MPRSVKWSLLFAILLWSSAFVGIRAALHGYSPEGLALLRYLVASLCMGVVYFFLPSTRIDNWKDRILLLLVGAIGIGFYNINLNQGEVVIESGLASFIISMSPVFTALFAIIFLQERVSKGYIAGLLICISGVLLIAMGEGHGFHWSSSLNYILLATLAGSTYSVMQKKFVLKYSIIEVTAYVIWGGTLFLLLFTPRLIADLHHTTLIPTLTVIYLGIFPAALGYLIWSHVLSHLSASRAVTFLYVQPFIVTIMGWVCLHEVPAMLAMCGGVCAIIGVYLVNTAL